MKRGVQKRFITGLMAFAMVLTQAILPAQIAFATNTAKPVYDVPTDGKITICHRTNSVTNPYVQETISVEAADGISGRNENGANADHYGTHKGPVFDVTADPEVAYPTPRNGDQWGDIIPPVVPNSTVAGANTAGLNWTQAGKDIYYNGCNVPAAPVKDASASVGVSAPTCDSSSVANVTSSVNATLSAPLSQAVGPQSATFTSTAGHLFSNGTSTFTVTYTIMGKLTGAQCESPKTPVTPNVTFFDDCETINDSVTAISVNGITYSSVTKNGLTYTVTASPSSNQYVLIAGNGFELNENGSATYMITLTDDDCETEPTEIPLPMGIADVCGRANDTVPMPKEDDKYSVLKDSEWIQDGEDTVKTVRTITYIADEGYVFEDGEGWMLSRDKTQATYTFTDFGTKCPSANICTVSNNLFGKEWQYDDDTMPEADLGGSYNFEPTGLYLNTPTADSYVYGLIDGGNTPIADVDAMSYSVLRRSQSAGFASTLPSYILFVDTNGLSVVGGLEYFLYEPYYNDNDRAAIEGEFQFWDAIDNGDAIWYVSSTGQAQRTWESLVDEYDDAVILAYGFNQGQDNPETFTAIQDLEFDCATTTFTNKDEGGSGGNPTVPVTPTTPVVTTPVTPVVAGKGALLPEELPLTGENGSLVFTWIALLAAILTYGSVYYLQPKKRFEQ